MSLENIELFPQNKCEFEVPSVHFEMLHDSRRIDTYQKAIREVVKPGDTVVDIGTGTGLLAFLAIQAGASHVYAIEETSIIKAAQEIAQVNNLSDRVTFYHANSKTVELAQKADMLVTETIGHLAFEEQIMETLLDARRRLLKPEGKIIPQRLTLQATPVTANEIYWLYLERWKERICGLDFSAMRRLAANNIYKVDFQIEHMVALPCPVFSFNPPLDTKLKTHPTVFDIHRNETVHGFLFWFDAQLSPNIVLSSAPWNKTHWQQCFLPLENPIKVSRGDKLLAKFSHQQTPPCPFFISLDSLLAGSIESR